MKLIFFSGHFHNIKLRSVDLIGHIQSHGRILSIKPVDLNCDLVTHVNLSVSKPILLTMR